MILEICVDDAAGLDAAIKGGADRIELCAALSGGGVTPSSGFMQLAGSMAVPVSVMIRPRSGDFVFGRAELDVMKHDIDAARGAGVSGVVLGASLANGALDTDMLEDLCAHAHGLDTTLHRAVDVVPDFPEAVEAAIALGFSRILTSGGAKSAFEGIDQLEAMIEVARGRISIMPGAGVRPTVVADILRRLAISEIHASCSSSAPFDADNRLSMLGFTVSHGKNTDEATVRQLKQILSSNRS
ncbi:copper homeostasis protein CutC [Agrobacterium rubi]|uniref:PF03932 family protein CutC n=1 Tax=Agrobacterium rubi TaxID=28099 RepID=A0AAE7USL3_9HYPH|nr:copper homeostasis protein CutC [Agrobacterium rubi]MCL6652663.1 copper homeostasis protein CutC [Agrobacterium rubi]NTE87467.1 copper homeostasis protein CutC [Agrobacterium rubi]NTF03321.1 copper homeostasis protein CutC [Agrobacterium rubi]NTF09761.1 copper homeostasis protein CutC [Agrobacterium rubi]NTF22062.1 copper homeostasis protein CutC [Agrobacterium rubi]